MSVELEHFIDETIRLGMRRGYTPTVFIGMRHKLGTCETIERLVKRGEIQSGFRRLEALGLLDATIEAAVLRFSDEFTKHARECAQWRLEQAKKH